MVCQWSLVSLSPVGSTRMSATFWVSLTSRESLSDLEQRVESHRIGRGRLEPPGAAELPPPPGGQRPVLLLDVVDEHRVRPAEQRGDDQAHALAAAGRCEAEDVLWAIVAHEGAVARRGDASPARPVDRGAKLRVAGLAEHHASVAQEARGPHLRGRGPPRAAVGLACGRRLAPEGSQRGDPHPGCGGERRERRGVAEDRGRPRLVAAAPLDPRPGRVDVHAAEGDPGRSELRGVPKLCGDVLGRAPESQERHQQESRQAERAHRCLHSGGGRRPPADG